MLKGAHYKGYVRPTIVYRSENGMEILSTVRSMVYAMCGVQLKDRKKAKDMILMLNLS